MATDERSLAVPSELYDFDLGDFGTQPDYPKEFLNGKVLYIWGVSESQFDGTFKTPARSLLHTWPTDPAGVAPWGALLSEDSPAIRQASEMQHKGKVPFVARLVLKDSQANKGQTYWTMERYTMQYDPQGNIVDPNAPTPPAPKEEEKKK